MSDALIAQFEGARAAGRSWVDLAERYRAAIVRSGMPLAEFDERVAKASGWKVATVKAWVPTLEYLEGLPEDLKPTREVAEANGTVISQIARLSRHDRAQARRYMEKVRKNAAPPVGELRRLLSVAAAGGSLKQGSERDLEAEARGTGLGPDRRTSALERSRRIHSAMKAVGSLMPTLSGRVADFRRPDGVNATPLRSEAIALLEDGAADGFDFIFSTEQVSHARFMEKLSRAAVAASFFRRFYLIFSDDSDRERAESAAAFVKLLKKQNVGIVQLRGEGVKPRMLQAPCGDPDRRNLLIALYEHGRWQDDWSYRAKSIVVDLGEESHPEEGVESWRPSP